MRCSSGIFGLSTLRQGRALAWPAAAPEALLTSPGWLVRLQTAVCCCCRRRVEVRGSARTPGAARPLLLASAPLLRLRLRGAARKEGAEAPRVVALSCCMPLLLATATHCIMCVV